MSTGAADPAAPSCAFWTSFQIWSPTSAGNCASIRLVVVSPNFGGWARLIWSVCSLSWKVTSWMLSVAPLLSCCRATLVSTR